MKLFNRPLGSYFTEVKTGLMLIAALAVIRFLMLPVFGVAYDSGNWFTSLFVLFPIVAIFYMYRASQSPVTTYNDILWTAFAVVVTSQVLIAVGIAIDDFAGIPTYFTDVRFGAENTLGHSAGHLFIVTTVVTLVLWGVGSLIKKLFGKKTSEAIA
jgi:hypothetical protein